MILRGMSNAQTGIPRLYANTPLTTLAPRQVVLRGLNDATTDTTVNGVTQEATAFFTDAMAFVKAHPIASALTFFIATR